MITLYFVETDLAEMEWMTDLGKKDQSPELKELPKMIMSPIQDVEETLNAAEQYRNQAPNPQFAAGLEKLYQVPMHRSLYKVARCLWDMWNSDPPEADTFWLISVSPGLKLTGIAVISERTRQNWSNYFSIDDAVSWEHTLDFQITASDIAFGPHNKPGFWGLYRHLKKVATHFLNAKPFKKARQLV